MKKLLMTLALMPLMALAASLKIGDETFKPSDKTGYTYTFSSCSATATYSASSGFRLTFGTSAVIVGNISWADGPGLSINIDPGATVALSGSITSNYGGELEICGPGRLQIVNGCIAPYSANIKFFGAIVDISTPDKSRSIRTNGMVDIKLSCVSISGYGALVHGQEGVNITASMVNLLSWPTSQGKQYAVLQHGSSQVGKPGGVSIVGSVVSIVGRDTETAGILTRRGLLITESCLAIVSDGPCISVSHTQDGGAQYFDNVRLFAVSQHGNAFDDDLAGNANYAFWGDGKYVLCAASEKKAAMVAKTVEVDDGDIELCSPQNYGAVAHTFLMKDGSFKMSGKLNKKLLREEILAESAVEGILTASLGWTSVQSEILLNMLEKLDAVLTTDVSGRAVAAVMSQEFVQTGGRVEQGAADCGHLAVDRYMARTKKGQTPAFTGGVFNGSFLMDYDLDDPHPLVNAPTNALGQTLTHVEYEPYWVYLNGGVTPIMCKVVFNANGGRCSTTSRQIAKGAKAGTLPTATWDGYDFLGWYTAASGGSKVSESTVVTSDVTWYAHWQVKASTYTIQFDAGSDGYWTTTANQRRTCKLNTVYALDMPNGLTGLSGKRLAGWRSSNGKRYDPGVLFFNLAQVGKSVTMTAIWDGEGGQEKELGGVQLWEGGPYWAECNVGATKPEEYGYYFWWGDTVGYKRNANNNGWISVKDSTYIRFNGADCPLPSEGYIDASGNLISAYDAATAHLGAPWRMPTEAEFSALLNNCTITWTTRNGVFGQVVTGKGAYSLKSIFLPAAGYGYESRLYYPGVYGRYWSSTSSLICYHGAWCLGFHSGYFDGETLSGYSGRSVRPVRGSPK